MRAPRWLILSGRLVRAAWLVVGSSLIVILALEGGYRAQGFLRGAVETWRHPPTPYPEAGEAWFDSLASIHRRPEELVWHAYEEYREVPTRSRYWNVDSLGLRRTIQASAAGSVRRDLFVFGGSSMLGTYLPDSATIPSRVAAELVRRGVTDVEVTNFGQTGYTFAQEAIQLLLQLRSGARPVAVVFFDGGNDVGAAVEGRPGFPRREDERARDWDVERQLFTWRVDLGTESRVLALLARIGAERLQLVKRMIRSPSTAAVASDDSLASQVRSMYLGTLLWVEALARHYRFAAYYAWEPLLGSADKPLSPYERRALISFGESASGRHTLAVRRLVPGRLASRAQALVPGRFTDLSGVFAGDSGTEFSNDAHTTVHGTAMVAAALAQRVAPLLVHAGTVDAPRSGGR